jgi:hypothetical protein
MSVKIPMVDISPWINCSEKEIEDHFSGLVISKSLQAVAEQWDYSFTNFGFAVIVGHGLLSDDMDNLGCFIFQLQLFLLPFIPFYSKI